MRTVLPTATTLASCHGSLHCRVMSDDYTLIILAGGAGSRMGGRDKGLVEYRGMPMAQRLLQRFRPPRAVISANRNLDAYRRLAGSVVSDARAELAGPLAGIEASLAEIGTPATVILPCDMPELPEDLVNRLLDACREPGGIAVAHDGERLQPLCLALREPFPREQISRYLDRGERSMHGWLDSQSPNIVRFADAKEAFANINR